MVSLTEKEGYTLVFLVKHYNEDYNINQLARQINISPAGMFKILKKLKEQDYLLEEKKGNNSFYKINYNSKDAIDTCIFALTDKTNNLNIKNLINETKKLQEKTRLTIFYGKIREKEKNKKIKALIIHNGDKKEVSLILEKTNSIIENKIIPFYMSEEEFKENIHNRDSEILEILKNGVVAEGRNYLIGVIKNENL